VGLETHLNPYSLSTMQGSLFDQGIYDRTRSISEYRNRSPASVTCRRARRRSIGTWTGGITSFMQQRCTLWCIQLHRMTLTARPRCPIRCKTRNGDNGCEDGTKEATTRADVIKLFPAPGISVWQDLLCKYVLTTIKSNQN
jgi:hypothetical protein